MNYSQEIGKNLAETLTELFVIDEMGIPLNEIRDLETLKGHLATAKEKYGVKHPKYQTLLGLHAKKEASEQRKAERMSRIKTRQEFHAKRYGYKPVKGSKRNEWVHGETGHKLSFGDGRSWSHMKSGGKRAKGGGATPIRDLRQHLAKLHESVIVSNEQELNEIRTLEKLRMQANQALLRNDPIAQEKLQRALMLQRRKRNVGVEEDEILEDESTPKVGDKVRSKEHGTVGYLHHIGDRGKAWVSDHPDGSSGQFHHLDSLVRYEK